jgi:hypothetical protein
MAMENELLDKGLNMNMPAWHFHVFDVVKINEPGQATPAMHVNPTSLQ